MTGVSWWELLPAVLTAGCFLWLPGFAIGLGWRLRLLSATCLAPLLSLFVVGASALLAHVTDSRWGIHWVVGSACVLSVAGLWRWRRGAREWAQALRGQALVFAGYLAGLAIAVAVLGRRLMWAFVSPSSIAQKYDNAFHLNASVYVYLTGRASGFDIGQLVGSGFYPASFHDAVALVMSATGLWVAPAVHAVNLFALFAMWPLSLMFLLEPFFKMSWVGRLVLGPLSLGLNAFPYGLMDWGLLYPNILALTITPALIAVGFRCFGKGERTLLSQPEALVLVIPGVVAAGLTHPNSVFLMIGVCLPLTLITAVRLLMGRGANRIGEAISVVRYRAVPVWAGPALARVVGVGLVILGVVVVPFVWMRASASLVSLQWSPFQTRAQALGEVLMGTGVAQPPFPLGVLVTVGVVWLVIHWRGRLWWALGAAVLASFYVVSSSFPRTPFRDAYVGLFYADSHRPFAYIAIIAVPLAVLGSQWVWTGIQDAVVRWRPAAAPLPGWAAVVIGVCVAIVFSAGTVRSTTFTDRMAQIQTDYVFAPNSSLLSENERQLLEEVKSVTTPNDVIVVDPWTGGGLVYALSQRMPTQFYMLSPVGRDQQLVDDRLRYAAEDPEVCSALHRMGATYVLSLDPMPVTHDPRGNQYQGFSDLASRRGFEPVVSVGQDTLYRITACG